MHPDKQFDKNLELARQHLTSLFDEPPDRWPPDRIRVVYAPRDDPELAAANAEALAAQQAASTNDPEVPTFTMIGPDFRLHPANQRPDSGDQRREVKPPA